jgi:hypothetical protein
VVAAEAERDEALAIVEMHKLATEEDLTLATGLERRVVALAAALEGLLGAVSEWFAGDLPPQLLHDHRVLATEAALAAVQVPAEPPREEVTERDSGRVETTGEEAASIPGNESGGSKPLSRSVTSPAPAEPPERQTY